MIYLNGWLNKPLALRCLSNYGIPKKMLSNPLEELYVKDTPSPIFSTMSKLKQL